MRLLFASLALYYALATISIGTASGQDPGQEAPLNATQLSNLGFDVTLHGLVVVLANTTKAQFLGPQAPPGTQKPSSTMTEPVQSKFSVLMAGGVHSFCVGNYTECGLTNNTSLLNSLLPEEDQVGYLSSNYTETSTPTRLTFYTYYRIPASDPTKEIRVNTKENFLSSDAMVDSLGMILTQVCSGQVNKTVDIVSYRTLTGQAIDACPSPATTPGPATTPATGLQHVTSTAGATVTTTLPGVKSQGVPLVTSQAVPLETSQGLPLVTSQGAGVQTQGTTQRATQAIATSGPTATGQASTAPAGPTAEPFERVAKYTVVGVTLAQFRADFDNLVAIAEGIVSRNCTTIGTNMPAEIEFNGVEITGGDGGAPISFTLVYAKSENNSRVDCARGSMGDSLLLQLADIFNDPQTIEDLQSSIANATLSAIISGTVASSTTVAAGGDAGLSTGALVGIGVGSAVVVLLLLMLAILFIKYGSGQAMKKSMSTMRVMPMEDAEVASDQTKVKEAWASESPGAVLETNA